VTAFREQFVTEGFGMAVTLSYTVIGLKNGYRYIKNQKMRGRFVVSEVRYHLAIFRHLFKETRHN
jgi:hypothetical protein